jgi:hypothetical protein
MPDLMIRDLPGAIPPSEQNRRITPNDLAWPENVGEDIIWLQIVLEDVEATETFLISRQYTKQWDWADRLFYAYVAPENWPGTNTPRSALGMPLVSTHLFSLLASVVQAFFSGNEPIKLDPREGTSLATAHANQALIMWELEKTDFRMELIYLLFDMLLYGTGCGWWGFQPYTRKKRKKVRNAKTPGSMALGEVSTKVDTETWVLPKFEYSHIRHYGVDPGHRRCAASKAGGAWRRMYLSADELDDLRDDDGFKNIPTRDQLEKLVAPDKEGATPNPMETGSEHTQASFGRKAMPRWQDTTADPLKQVFEVIEYWTPDRTIYVFERTVVIRNATHELEKIPALSCPLFISPDSYYGMGLGHLIGNFQRVEQGVVNLYLDDLSLDLNGMYVTGKGYNNPGQAIWSAPGRVVKVDDAEQFKKIEKNSVGPDAMGMIEACENWAQQADGANDITVQGNMPSERSSITRTAGGASLLGTGSRTKLEFLIDNVANLVIIPLVEAFMGMNFENLAPEQIKTILGEELGHAYEEDPINLLNGSYKITVSAGARLQARNALAQMWPMLQNMLTSPTVLAALQTEGKKVNYTKVVDEQFRSVGYPGGKEFVVDQTPQDEARTKAMNPAMNRIAEIQSKVAAETQGQLEVEENKAGGRALIQVLRHAMEVEDKQAMGG